MKSAKLFLTVLALIFSLGLQSLCGRLGSKSRAVREAHGSPIPHL